jgi:hypothetical protein
MPIPFAPLVGFLLGVSLAWAASNELARDDGPMVASRPFAIVLAFAALLYTPVVAYFVAFHGDWAYLYEVSWRNVPSAIDFALVLLGGASVFVGFVVAAPLLRKRRLGIVSALTVGAGSLVLALLALSARRLVLSATYAQFHGDFGTEPITQSALGRGVLFMGIILAAGLAWCIRAMWAMNAEAKR